MSKKEQEFYEYLEQHHAPLLPFTSQYLGVVNVTYRASNAQPILPEVILQENQHLLASWKNDCSNNTRHRQQQQYPPRIRLRRHSSSFTLKTRSDQGYLLGVRTLIACFFWIYVNHGGNKDDLVDLDDTSLSMDRLPWLDGDYDTQIGDYFDFYR